MSTDSNEDKKDVSMGQDEMTAAILAIDYVLLSKILKPGTPHDHNLIEKMDTDLLQEARARIFEKVEGDPGHKPG